MVTLDTIRAFETPEGVELQLRVAGPIARAAAWSIDLAVRAVLYIVLGMVFPAMADSGVGIFFIGIFLIEWFYPVLFEVYSGQTPGKRAMDLLVINDNGTPIDWPSSLIRNLLRVADFLPMFYGVGLISTLINKDFKRLGDLAAGTLVIYKDAAVERPPIPAREARTPPFTFDYPAQRAILDFAERTQRLTEGRSAELAELLQSLTDKTGRESVDEVLGYANWLTGEHSQ